jgi:hypothetical protein
VKYCSTLWWNTVYSCGRNKKTTFNGMAFVKLVADCDYMYKTRMISFVQYDNTCSPVSVLANAWPLFFNQIVRPAHKINQSSANLSKDFHEYKKAPYYRTWISEHEICFFFLSYFEIFFIFPSILDFQLSVKSFIQPTPGL